MTPQLLLTIIISFLIVTVEFAACFCAPLLPLVRSDFLVDPAFVQMTMSLYLLGLGISALLYGPLSDILGRKPILLTGLGVFCLTSLGCYWAPSIYWLVGIRLLQGLGAGAAWAVSNGVVKDSFPPQIYTKIMTVIHIIVGFVPAVAPIMGSYLGALLGWRNCFLALFFLACLTVAVVSYFLKETLPQKSSSSLAKIFSGYGVLLRSPLLCRYMILKVLMVTLLFVDASNLSLIFVENYNVSVMYFGYYVALGFIGYLLGGWACHKLIDLYGNDRLLAWGLGCVLSSNIVVFILGMLNVESAMLIQFCRLPIYFGWGIMFGNATGCIVAPFAERAGAAAAMMIGLEMFFSFIGVYIMSLIYDGTVLPFACFMIVTTLIVLTGFYGLRKHKIAHFFEAKGESL